MGAFVFDIMLYTDLRVLFIYCDRVLLLVYIHESLRAPHFTYPLTHLRW